MVFQWGNAAFQCPVPPNSSLIYLDLEQLSLIALQQGLNNVIQTPQLCGTGADDECSKQQCCHEEVGCCYTDPHKHIRKCGCKMRGTKSCTYSAPLAILTNTECGDDKKRKISTCLRKKRENEESYIVTWNTNKQPGSEAVTNSPKSIFDLILHAINQECEASGCGLG